MKTYKLLWVIWFALAILFVTGTAAYLVSSKLNKVNITLKEGEIINTKLFRIHPHHLSLELRFKGEGRDSRPELGNYKTEGNWQETGLLKFTNPGEPIKLLVNSANQRTVYEALPASGYGQTTIIKRLQPFVNDNDHTSVSWPPGNDFRHQIKQGLNSYQITVIEVGKSLINEEVSLVINPPISFKTVAQNYSYLWCFYFWPLYAFVLVISAMILTFKDRRRTKIGKLDK